MWRAATILLPGKERRKPVLDGPAIVHATGPGNEPSSSTAWTYHFAGVTTIFPKNAVAVLASLKVDRLSFLAAHNALMPGIY